MKRPGDSIFKASTAEPASERPGRVVELKGIIFQSDASSAVGTLFIRPIESFDRWQAGLSQSGNDSSLAMHAGLHVVLEDGREFVAEQLVGSIFEDFEDGLNWTPVEKFRARDHQGWDVTVPATQFRKVDEALVRKAVDGLNKIQGRPFFGEDCTGFIERAFGGQRLFGDSPTGIALGMGLRVGDPALPLLRPDAKLEPRAARLLRADAVRQQPNPTADATAPNAHLWLGRIIVWSVTALALFGIYRLTKRAYRD